ncbi:hypothetical protein B0H11DRAFT_1662951, partial [Mycena galericulata]
LFLFQPRVHIEVGELLVHVPPLNEAYFWSHDPYGRSRLSSAGARDLGMPHVFMQARVGGSTWPRADYELLRQFHFAKGFNPDSSEIAHRLGYP